MVAGIRSVTAAGRLLGAVVLASSVTALASGARAQAPVVPLRVRITLVDCDESGAEPSELVRLTRLELGSDGVEDVTTSLDVETRARVTIRGYPCDATSASSVVTIDDALTRKWVRRDISVSDFGAPERPRALALAVAELLRASWAELAFIDDPEAPPALVRSIDRRIARRRDGSSGVAFGVSAAAGARVFPTSPVLLLGGRAALAIDLDGWRIGAGALVTHGVRDTVLGDIDILLATGFLEAGRSLARAGRLRLGLDARFELGSVSATGDPSRDDVQALDAAGLAIYSSLELSLAIRLFPGVYWTFGLEAGAALAGVDLRADAHDAANLSNLLLSLWTGTGSR